MSSDTIPAKTNFKDNRRKEIKSPGHRPGQYHISNAGTDVIVRKNCFGEVEHLDRRSYEESVKTEQLYNEELENYLNASSPTRKGMPAIVIVPKELKLKEVKDGQDEEDIQESSSDTVGPK